uniref:F-box domain-containing protein n=1 Tax=Stomoxys calcitrans TaxID=35570 RepID=A0A1I8P2V5_STOCA
MDLITAEESVFHNDGIMTHILRILDLRKQCELQRICERFRHLIVRHIWSIDYCEVQMSRGAMATLSDEEFFEFLEWNVQNLQKLVICRDNGEDVLRFFPRRYENLVELQIMGVAFHDNEWRGIARLCPQLQILDYNEEKDSQECPEEQFVESLKFLQTLENLLLFRNLRILILSNLFQPICYGTLQMLAHELPLEHFEWHNLEIRPVVKNSKELRDLKFERLQILKITCTHEHQCHGECWHFVQKCPNLRDLHFSLERNVPYEALMFEKMAQLERLSLEGCSFVLAFEIIKRLTQLKYLYIGDLKPDKEECKVSQDNFEITRDVIVGSCGHLQCLKVNVNHYRGDFKYWFVLLRKPRSIFENLQELYLASAPINDHFIRLLSLRCHHLRKLHLRRSKITGKYMNRLKKLQSLTLAYNCAGILWSHLFSAFRDLLVLEHLVLEDLVLSKDEIILSNSIYDLGQSWKFLKITHMHRQMEFWLHILAYCYGCFSNIRTLLIADYTARGDGLTQFFASFRQVPTLILQTCHKLYNESQITVFLTPFLKELILVDCKSLDWSYVVKMIRTSKVKSFQIFHMPVKVDYKSRHPTSYQMAEIVENLRAVTLPYQLFSETYDVWQQLVAACPNFRFGCMGQYCHHMFLDLLLDKPALMERVTAIYANTELAALKKYCAENLNKSATKVTVRLLDKKHRKLWNLGEAVDDVPAIFVEM